MPGLPGPNNTTVDVLVAMRRNKDTGVSEAVRDIEYGVTSKVFEFTIINNEPDDAYKKLQKAAEYAFN